MGGFVTKSLCLFYLHSLCFILVVQEQDYILRGLLNRYIVIFILNQKISVFL